MTVPIVEIGIFLFSSVLIIVLNYLQVSTSILLKIIAVLLVALLFIINHYFFSRNRPIPSDWLRYSLLTLFTFFIQLFVLTTGGFFSPFLILFHLYTLGISFLLNLTTSISFLIFSLLALIANILVDQNTYYTFQEDPWAVVLYAVSFTIIVPLSWILPRHYHLKDGLFKILLRELKKKEGQLNLEERRRESLIESFNDLVFVTDINLNILSTNEAVKKVLRLTKSEIINKNLLETMVLRNNKGEEATTKSLFIDKAMAEKKPYQVSGFLLYAKNTTPANKVSLQVRPILDLDGKIDQIIITLINEEKPRFQRTSFNIEEARLRYEAVIEQFKERLNAAKLIDLKSQAELLGKTEQDLLTAVEIENYNPKPTNVLRNMDRFCEQVVIREQDFAQSLGVELNFIISKEFEKSPLLTPKNARITPHILPSPYYIAPIDVKWFELLLEKLLEIVLLLASEEKGNEVKLELKREGNIIDINLRTSYRQFSNEEKRALFEEYYKNFTAGTNLGLGSGLEGYLVKTIATLLNVPLGLEYDSAKKQLTFILRLQRKLS